MIDTTIVAAYAAQYARKSGKEPRAGYFCSNIGQPYSYVDLDDLSYWLSDDDQFKETIKTYGWEVHTYDDDRPSRLYAVPDHTPGGTRLVNKIDFCGFIDFKDSRRATDVNIRNVVMAAKELVWRCNQCTDFIEKIKEKFTKLPKNSDLADYIGKEPTKDSWAIKVAKKYGYNIDIADDKMIYRAISVLDTLHGCGPVGVPFVKVGANVARHWVENILRMCEDVKDPYLNTDSFGIAASIYMEDHYSADYIKDGLQLPQMFETLKFFDEGN